MPPHEAEGAEPAEAVADVSGPLPPGGDAPVSPSSGADAPSTAPPRRALAWWLTASVILADQTAKAAVRAKLDQFDTVTVVPGWLDFIHVRNAGVAFGILNEVRMDDTIKMVITTALAGLALLGITIYARHVNQQAHLARAGLSMILGGAAGNLIDRLRLGYVLDYVDVYHGGWHFWAFNVADASITIGAVFVFLDLLLVTRHAPHPVPDR